MKKDFYIFRHGQTDMNVRNVWQGCDTDVLLNETGKKQAQELQKRVNELNLTSLYSSPLLRAVETANFLANQGQRRLDFEICFDLRECCFGECEGQTFDATKQKYGEKFIETMLFPTRETWDVHFPKGESKHQVFDRVHGALLRISDSNNEEEDNRIGIVCHAGVINALQCGMNLQNVSYDNCSILHLSYDTETKEWAQMPN